MATFIQLHRRGTNAPTFVNIELIKRVTPLSEERGVMIASVGDADSVRFVETYETVVQMIREALDQ